MIWDGSNVYTIYGYRPDTQPAIKWQALSNGNYRGADRGASEDIFLSNVIFQGPRSELETLEAVLDGARREFDATFGTGEEVFGADIDYSSAIQVTVTNYGKISQLGYDKWGMTLTLRAYQPTFQSVTETLSVLRLSSHVSEQYSKFDITKKFTYDEMAVYGDHASDPGIFEGQFTQTTEEMAQLRRYLLNTLRNGSATPFPTFGGIETPFGYREGTGPFTFRVISWTDMGRPNFIDWTLKMKIARDFV